jgi:hypothetical protein
MIGQRRRPGTRRVRERRVRMVRKIRRLSAGPPLGQPRRLQALRSETRATLVIVQAKETEQALLRCRLEEVLDTFAFGLDLKRRSLRLQHPGWTADQIEAELERWVRSDDP